MSNDFKVAGAGIVPQGEYENISISGRAKIDGNVKCVSLSASGALSGNGNIECSDTFKLSGSAKVEGDLKCSNIKISGSAKTGSIDFSDMNLAGGFKCDGSLKGYSFKAAGGIKVKGGIECENIKITGSVVCGGLINGDNIELVIEGESGAESIGGGTIRISGDSREAGILARLFRKANGTLSVESSVEGDEIDISYVHADSVSGRNVKIGKGCRIRTVRYSESFEADPDATIENTEKI